MRTYDANLVARAVEFFRKTEEDFDPIDWVSNQANIALINDNDDMVLFEHEIPKVVTAHYYLKSRGRAAIQACKEFFKEIWADDLGIEIIRGLTPLTNLGARWMNRHLGLTSHGVVNTTTGYHELVTIHRSQYEALYRPE